MFNRECAKCHGPNERTKPGAPRQGYCHACHSDYMRRWRSEHVYVKRGNQPQAQPQAFHGE